MLMVIQSSLKCETKSISPNVSNIAYLIETSIENMDILAWFPLLLYKPNNKETMVSFCVN